MIRSPREAEAVEAEEAVTAAEAEAIAEAAVDIAFSGLKQAAICSG